MQRLSVRPRDPYDGESHSGASRAQSALAINNMSMVPVAPDLSADDLLEAAKVHEFGTFARVSLPAPAHRVLLPTARMAAGHVALSIPQQCIVSTLSLDTHPVRIMLPKHWWLGCRCVVDRTVQSPVL